MPNTTQKLYNTKGQHSARKQKQYRDNWCSSRKLEPRSCDFFHRYSPQTRRAQRCGGGRNSSLISPGRRLVGWFLEFLSFPPLPPLELLVHRAGYAGAALGLWVSAGIDPCNDGFLGSRDVGTSVCKVCTYILHRQSTFCVGGGGGGGGGGGAGSR